MPSRPPSGASFPSAQFAVERKDPVMQLMTVVEQHGDDAFLARMVPRLLAEPIEDVARSAEVQAEFAPMKAQHEAFIELVRGASKEKDGVVLVDLSDKIIDAAGKFVTYALYPQSAYSVLLSRSWRARSSTRQGASTDRPRSRPRGAAQNLINSTPSSR